MKISKIIIVDDEEDIRRVIELSVRGMAQWNVLVAGSGEEALIQARRERPDVILLDVMMPGMDGLTTLERLREHEATASIPVIFLTARVQKHEIERYLALGAVGVIRKPFDPMMLADEIQRIVEDSARGDLERELNALRESYRQRLPEKLQELETAVLGAKRESPSQEALRRAQRLAHTLDGTVGTYGFVAFRAQVGVVKLKLETLLDDPASNADEIWAEIEEALRRARSCVAAPSG